MPLFLIFGISTKLKAKPSGPFVCPACQTERPYAELRQSRWFTLFFIPLIPLGSSSQGRVQCTACGSEFDADVVT
ncbi:MAG: zinc-ribbon domain-containing protein [Maioricimonas sp. JB049]